MHLTPNVGIEGGFRLAQMLHNTDFLSAHPTICYGPALGSRLGA